MNREATIEITPAIEAMLRRYKLVTQIIASEKVVGCSFDIEKELDDVTDALAVYFAERAGVES
jgi:hypothetical protein